MQAEHTAKAAGNVRAVPLPSVSASQATTGLVKQIKIGNYLLGTTIGKGNSAVVKIATHVLTRQKVKAIESERFKKFIYLVYYLKVRLFIEKISNRNGPWAEILVSFGTDLVQSLLI